MSDHDLLVAIYRLVLVIVILKIAPIIGRAVWGVLLYLAGVIGEE